MRQDAPRSACFPIQLQNVNSADLGYWKLLVVWLGGLPLALHYPISHSQSMKVQHAVREGGGDGVGDWDGDESGGSCGEAVKATGWAVEGPMVMTVGREWIGSGSKGMLWPHVKRRHLLATKSGRSQSPRAQVHR